MRHAIGLVLMLGVILTGVPGVLLMRAARWFGDRMREVTR